jgi:hypothetical protein
MASRRLYFFELASFRNHIPPFSYLIPASPLRDQPISYRLKEPYIQLAHSTTNAQ